MSNLWNHGARLSVVLYGNACGLCMDNFVFASGSPPIVYMGVIVFLPLA